MRKTLFLIIIISFLALVFFLVALRMQKNLGRSGPLTTPITPYTSTAPNRLFVVSTRPSNKAAIISLNQAIAVAFNRTILPNEVGITISPQLPFSVGVQDNTLLITPQSPLTPGTLYTYAIHYLTLDQLPNLFTFTTTGPTQSQLPDTGLPGGAETNDAYLVKNRPDIYLSNRLPYSGTSFTITSTYKTTPTRHFAFTIGLTGDEALGRSEALAWLKSLGLTDQQIRGLDITYER